MSVEEVVDLVVNPDDRVTKSHGIDNSRDYDSRKSGLDNFDRSSSCVGFLDYLTHIAFVDGGRSAQGGDEAGTMPNAV